MPDPTPSTAKSPARRAMRVLAVILGALGGLLGAELAYRVHLYGPAALTPAGMNSIRTIGESGMTRAADAWELRYELKPGLDQLFKLVPFRTNAHGHRDDPCDLAKPAGGWRATFVGDSFTMGSGVEHADLFHTRLEARWRERDPSRSIECLNLGVAGYNLFAYVGVVRHRALAFDPDLVVVCLTSNDFKPPYQSPDLAPYEPRPLDHPFWRLRLLQGTGGEAEASVRTAGLLPWPLATGPPAPARAQGAPDDTAARKAAYVVEQLKALSDLCAEADAELALVYLCHKSDDRFRKLGQNVAGHARALGIPFFSTEPSFADIDFDDVSLFPDDGHPNAQANALFADGIGAFLEQRGLDPRR